MSQARNNSKRFHELRSRYPEFVYEGHSVHRDGDRWVIIWDFRMGTEIRFRPRLVVPHVSTLNTEQATLVLETLGFQLGMVELISYWKTACPPRIVIKPYSMDEEGKAFWSSLYYLGLGEFRYLNGIDIPCEEFLSLECVGRPMERASFPTDPSRYLVPIGGGKDSAVTLSLLGGAGRDVVPFMLNPLPASLRTVSAAGIPPARCLIFRRQLDPLLLQLNDAGYLNGHTPFSALLAFTTLIASYLSGSGRIALSNEASANEATVPGTDINHQYSKSYHFEASFRDYVRGKLKLPVDYFSLLRPLNELQIASLFAREPRFHSVFRSCNAGSKEDRWCGNCPKCLFTAIILAPYMDDNELRMIFGKDMLEDEALKPWLDELAGWSDI
ncbi:MAG TPA: hypothetical protein P5550_11770, partial [Bacteroidales bacterium]|nr:hypothetical protein [Bacteroidales bacterium]